MKWIRGPRGGSARLTVLAAVAVLFAPFLFLGEHAVAFHYERGCWTGLPLGVGPAVPGPRPFLYDASPLCIHYPDETLAAEALRQGGLPVWNPYAGAGTAALGGGSVYPFSPFFWPFYLFPNPWVYTAGLLLICLWGGAGVFLWLGRFGVPRWARGFGAAFWILSPWVTHFFTYSDVWAAAWFGWLLWAWDRQCRETWAWWLPAPFVAGMVYCGHPEVALVLAGASGFYAMASWASMERNERVPFRSLGAGGVGTAALAAAITAVHWLPVALRATESLPYKFLSPQALLRSAGTAGDFLSPRSAVYIAPSVIGLAFLGLAWIGRSKTLWLTLLMPAMALTGLLQPSAFGPINDVLTLGGLVPGFYYRSLLWFGLVPLLAAGAASLADIRKERRIWRGALLLAPVLLFGAGFVVGPQRPGAEWVLWEGTALAILGATALLVSSPHRGWWAAAALGLVCLDPFVLLTGCLSERSPYAFESDRQACWSRFTRSDPSRLDPSSWGAAKGLLEASRGRMWAGSTAQGTMVLAPNLSTAWAVRDLRIQDVLLGRRMAVLHQTVQGTKAPPYFASLSYSGTAVQDLALLGVTHIGRPVDEDSGRFVWEEVAGALPRAYLVHEVRASASEEESARLWREGLSDRAWYKRGAIVEGWAGPVEIGEPRGSDSVIWLEDGLARVRLKATAPSGGVLVLLDAMAEGWEAFVDGRPSTLYAANLAFRSVSVPPGTHEVAFVYGAPGLVRGLLLAGVGWLSVVGLALLAWMRTAGGRRRAPGGAP